MREPPIVVSGEFINCSLQMVVTEFEPVIETFVPDGPYPPLCDCIGRWSFHWSTELSDIKRCNSAIEGGAKAAITVVNQVTRYFSRYPAGFAHPTGNSPDPYGE
jgi:hypothetical protein